MNSKIIGIIIILYCIVSTAITLHQFKILKTFETKPNNIDSLHNKYLQDLNKITKDSVYENKVTNITNNYKNIYEKNDIIHDTLRNKFIDSILARHRKIKLERSYLLPDTRN